MLAEAEFFQSPVYPILDLAVCEARRQAPLELLQLWEDLGLTFYQLRAKNLSMEDYLELALKLAGQSPLRLIVNDHYSLLEAHPFAGCHLGQSDRLHSGVLPGKGFLGLSTHNVEEFQTAMAEGWSYVALGPCFAGGIGKKEQMEPLLSRETLNICLDLAHRGGSPPVVLIGGLQADNYPMHPALPVPAGIAAALERGGLKRLIKKVEEARALYRMET